jgi:glycosyltransferase involved in cell wall biosynthesis
MNLNLNLNPVSRLLDRLPGERAPYRPGESRVHQIGLSCNPLPPDGYGGIETIVTNLTKGLVARDVPVTCYAPAPFRIDGADFFETLPEKTTGPKEGVDSANTREHLAAVTEGLRTRVAPGDIVHFHHSEHFPYIYKRLRKSDPGRLVNYVETAHWTNVGAGRRIVYPSRALQRHIDRPGRVIPHGIDRSVFSADGERESGEYVLYAGRITEDKGVHLCAEAVADSDYELRVAGPLVDEAYAERFLGDVTYLGELDQDALVRQYRGAAGFLYMTQYTEPFGLAVVEAMSCGTPVITTGYGGAGETVVDGETGFHCETVDEIRAALSKLDDLDRSDCIDRAKNYDIDAMTDRYAAHYEELYARKDE